MTRDLDDWDSMPPAGREWGAPCAETLWALDAMAERLAGSGLALQETEVDWHLTWHGRDVARWITEDTDWQALRATVTAVGGTDPVRAWDAAVAVGL